MRRYVLILTVLLLTPSLGLFAQGRGGGGGGQHGQRSAGGPQQPGQRPDTGRPADAQRGPQAGRQDRQRIHATEQQREQHRTCDQVANRVRTRARAMAQAAKGGGFNNEEFRRQHEQLREEIRAMHQERDRFATGLTPEQGEALQDRIRAMDQSRDRVNQPLQDLDRELAQREPDRKRLAEYSRELEKAMKEWQKRHREMGSDLGIER